MPSVDLHQTSVRELNQALHGLRSDTNETHWLVARPEGRHAIAAGLDMPAPDPRAAEREDPVRARQRRRREMLARKARRDE